MSKGLLARLPLSTLKASSLSKSPPPKSISLLFKIILLIHFCWSLIFSCCVFLHLCRPWSLQGSHLCRPHHPAPRSWGPPVEVSSLLLNFCSLWRLCPKICSLSYPLCSNGSPLDPRSPAHPPQSRIQIQPQSCLCSLFSNNLQKRRSGNLSFEMLTSSAT